MITVLITVLITMLGLIRGFKWARLDMGLRRRMSGVLFTLLDLQNCTESPSLRVMSFLSIASMASAPGPMRRRDSGKIRWRNGQLILSKLASASSGPAEPAGVLLSKYSYNWLISTMNLQVAKGSESLSTACLLYHGLIVLVHYQMRVCILRKPQGRKLQTGPYRICYREQCPSHLSPLDIQQRTVNVFTVASVGACPNTEGVAHPCAAVWSANLATTWLRAEGSGFKVPGLGRRVVNVFNLPLGLGFRV